MGIDLPKFVTNSLLGIIAYPGRKCNIFKKFGRGPLVRGRKLPDQSRRRASMGFRLAA